MRIAIAQAYNGLHKVFKKKLSALKVDSFYFNIDKLNWYQVEYKKPDAYVWLADNKEERYHLIHDKVYFIEKIINKPIFPDMNMYFAEGDKVKQWQILNYFKAPQPKTYILTDKTKVLTLIKKIKYPFILKDPYGYGGIHVFKINNQAEAKKYINKIFDIGLKTNYSTCQNIFYAQEFIEANRDLRVITIGNKIAAAYWRQGPAGQWKHNLEQGGRVDFTNIPKSALTLCLKISQKMKYHWMGYDLLLDKKGNVKIIEYSCNVRTKGAEQGGYDIRKRQMEYMVNYLKFSISN